LKYFSFLKKKIKRKRVAAAGVPQNNQPDGGLRGLKNVHTQPKKVSLFVCEPKGQEQFS